MQLLSTLIGDFQGPSIVIKMFLGSSQAGQEHNNWLFHLISLPKRGGRTRIKRLTLKGRRLLQSNFQLVLAVAHETTFRLRNPINHWKNSSCSPLQVLIPYLRTSKPNFLHVLSLKSETLGSNFLSSTPGCPGRIKAS